MKDNATIKLSKECIEYLTKCSKPNENIQLDSKIINDYIKHKIATKVKLNSDNVRWEYGNHAIFFVNYKK